MIEQLPHQAICEPQGPESHMCRGEGRDEGDIGKFGCRPTSILSNNSLTSGRLIFKVVIQDNGLRAVRSYHRCCFVCLAFRSHRAILLHTEELQV